MKAKLIGNYEEAERAQLAQAYEKIILTVWNCARRWQEEERINAIVRLARNQ